MQKTLSREKLINALKILSKNEVSSTDNTNLYIYMIGRTSVATLILAGIMTGDFDEE